MSMEIILGSSSKYRAECLKKIIKNFSQISPNIDESGLENENAYDLVLRLAKLKSLKILENIKSDSILITSDQVAVFDDEILGKPDSFEDAVKQLSKFSGNKVTFYTSLCVINSKENKALSTVETFDVFFRKLSKDEILSYIKKDNPLNCAGSFKSEGLGIVLFEKLSGNDYNSLIGLPLIKLSTMLISLGYNPILNF